MMRLLGLIAGVCLTYSAHAGAVQPLRLGILPLLSAKVLLTNYQPLRIYLERELQRPVELNTSPDFKRFQQDTLAGDFDLLVTAPHLARLAQMEAGFLPVATYIAPNRAVLIMAKNRPVAHISELRGHTLGIFDPLALTVLQAQHWLEDKGLKAGRDYRAVLYPSHTSVGYSVQRGDSLLGVTAPAGIRQFSPDIRAQVQVYAELPPVPALIWLAHPRLASQADRIEAALLRFAESPEGAQFYAGTEYKGMRPVNAEELRALDRSAREVGRLLKGLP